MENFRHMKLEGLLYPHVLPLSFTNYCLMVNL